MDLHSGKSWLMMRRRMEAVFAMDIVDVLLGEHGVLYAAFAHLEAERESPPEMLRASGELVASVLLSHSEIEDDLLFRALEPLIGIGSPQLVGMRMMHEHIDRGLQAFRTATNVAEALAYLFGAIELSRQHFLGEEQTLFPTARERIPPDSRQALGNEWATRRGLVVE
jgi:hemerythrin-like domain-containing protein